MTFEHAVAVTTELADQKIGNFCATASLDAVMQHANIDPKDYLLVSQRYEEESKLTDDEFEAYVDSPDYVSFHDEMADKYFSGKYIVGDIKTAEWHVNIDDDPFNPALWEYIGVPKPRHHVYKLLIDKVIAEQRYDPDYEYAGMTLAALRTRIGTLIAVDNAFDAGLTVLGVRENEDGGHVFGISRNDNKYYIFDTPNDDRDVQQPVVKIGPMTLQELVKLPENNRPTEWTPLDGNLPETFGFVSGENGFHYAIRLFPQQ